MLGEDDALTTAFTGGGDPFVTAAADLSPWLFTAGAGLVTNATETLTFEARYDMQASPSGYLNQIGSVQVKWRL